MSKHQYAFGRLESRRDQVRSVLVPRRLKGLLGALGGAVLLVLFAAIAFALVDRSPSPAAKPLEKTAGAAERPGSKPMGASSRPKTDLRQSQAAIQPRVRRSDPVPEAPVEPRQAQSEAPASLPASAPAPVPPPVRVTAAERTPLSEPPRAIQPPEDITASLIELADQPAEQKPAKDAGWPVVPKQAARNTAGESSKAPTDCLPGPLRAVLRDLEARFGPVTIISTTHLNSDNHTAGTIRDKLHQACKAVDIRANRDPKEVIAFLKSRPEVGGINTYRNRLVHFDLNANYKPGNERTEAAASTRPVRR